jgi:hypothetical protein
MRIQFEEKFIGFMDILGFKGLVAAAETGTGPTLDEVIRWTKELGSVENKYSIEKYGGTICPCSPRISKNLSFEITQISDCVIVSSEISPAGAVNLVNHGWGAIISLLRHGLMCRGYITKGKIHHRGETVIGTGYQRAYEKESQVRAFKVESDERGTPFVEVDNAVVDYIEENGDACVKEMFSRFVKTDGDVTALFPFNRIAHSFIIAGFAMQFDPIKEKESVQTIRTWLQKLRGQVLSRVDYDNQSAVSKAQHYVRALDAQLAECDRTDEAIDRLTSPVQRFDR